jgi:cytochrome c oxidase assembly protein Cox11
MEAAITITILLATYASVGFVCYWVGVNGEIKRQRQIQEHRQRQTRRLDDEMRRAWHT